MCSAALFMSPLTNDSWALAMPLSGSVAASLGGCGETTGMAIISTATRNALHTDETLRVIWFLLAWVWVSYPSAARRPAGLVLCVDGAGPCASLFHLAVLVGHVGAALGLASLLGAQRLGLVGAHLRRRIVGAAMGLAHLARGHPDLGRASTRRERGNQRDPDDQSTIRHLTSPLKLGELPLRVSVSRDSIRQIFRSAEAGY